MATTNIRSRYEPGRSVTEYPQLAVDQQPTDMLRALMGRETTYLDERRREQERQPRYSTQDQYRSLAPRPQMSSMPAYQPAPQVQHDRQRPKTRAEYLQEKMLEQSMQPLPQSMIGAGAGPGFTPAMGVDWSMVPAYMRGQYENPIAQAAQTRANTFRTAMVPSNDPGGGGRYAGPPPERDERPAWWINSQR